MEGAEIEFRNLLVVLDRMMFEEFLVFVVGGFPHGIGTDAKS